MNPTTYNPTSDRIAGAIVFALFAFAVYAYADSFAAARGPIMDCTTARWQEYESLRGTMPTPAVEAEFRRDCVAIVRGGE